MAVKFPNVDLPLGLTGARDIWDQPQASIVLSDDFFVDVIVSPVITVQPENEVVNEFQTAEFTATVSGADSLYWQYRIPDSLIGSLDFNGGYAFRTDAPNHNAAYSILFWIKIDTDTNDFQHFVHVGGSNSYDGNTDFIGTNTGSGTVMRVGCAGGATDTFDASGMGSFTVGTGYWLAMVRETATVLKFYKGTSSSDLTLVKTLTNDVSSRAAAARIQFGGYNSLNLDGKISLPKIWSGIALSLDQLKNELISGSSFLSESLWSYPKFYSFDIYYFLEDTSGNGRDFSITGVENSDYSLSSDGPTDENLNWLTLLEDSTTLSIPDANIQTSGFEFRLVAINITGLTSSNVVTLTVNPTTLPIVVDAVALAIGTSATPGAQAITVPSDAEGVIVFSRAFASSGPPTLSLTSDFSDTFTIVQDTGNERTAVAYANVTSVGSKTITPSWTTAPEEGPLFFVVFVKNIDNSSVSNWVRDADALASDTQVGLPDVTLTTEIDDLVIALDSLYDSNFPGPPPNSLGWSSVATQDVNLEAGRVRSIYSDSTSIVVDSEAVADYRGIAAISIYSVPAVGPILKYWNGSAWIEKPLKQWNGSAWVTGTIKYYNGSAWV